MRVNLEMCLKRKLTLPKLSRSRAGDILDMLAGNYKTTFRCVLYFLSPKCEGLGTSEECGGVSKFA